MKTDDGYIVYIQRPPALSTDPNDVNAQMAALGLASDQIYKISIGPLDVHFLSYLNSPLVILLTLTYTDRRLL